MGQDEVGRWVRLNTYGGKLTENVTQAVARDILVYAMKNLEKAGYYVVLHIHDEIVCEVDKGWGTVEEMERIMSTMPAWCSNWPVKAAGGWCGLRYRKG
jgi:DNA polymerase